MKLGYLRKVGAVLAPPPPTSDDGRDQWPSRAAFLLAAMGGCAGQGNLLRYPSVVYNNYGLQASGRVITTHNQADMPSGSYLICWLCSW